MHQGVQTGAFRRFRLQRPRVCPVTKKKFGSPGLIVTGLGPLAHLNVPPHLPETIGRSPTTGSRMPRWSPVTDLHPETPRFEHPPSPERMFSHEDFRADDLAEIKARSETSVTVALPARNEEATVGPIVATIRKRLVDDVALIDELLVIDDASTDNTAGVAAGAGATVVDARRVLGSFGSGGKGEALWKSLRASTGDVIIWCDADIVNFDERFIVGCLGPLLTRPDIGFIKGFYRRPLNTEGEGGGRVTELVARPLISTLFPALGEMVQPLSGEFGGRRELLEAVPFHRGYAVDLGLLIDLTERFGIDRIGQVDLGARLHRNRPLRELGPQAASIMAMALERAGHPEPHPVDEPEPGFEEPSSRSEVLVMARPEFGDAHITVGRLPPMASVPPGRDVPGQANLK